MKKKLLLTVLLALCILGVGAKALPTVYFTSDISSEGLMRLYEALGVKAEGENVAIKLSTGELGGNHYLDPNLIKELVQEVNGTIVESNTAYYGSKRASNAMHYMVAKTHGFTEIADFVILDENGSLELPIKNGKHIKENFVGEHFSEYDYHVVLSHFKGHAMAGFGGAIKNISIGYASKEGKCWIHSAGGSKRSMSGWPQDAFLESMADAASSVVDYLGGNMMFFNVMNHLSVDCDCDNNPAPPTMADIGMLASLDPVALDQACIDLVYSAKDSKDLVNRIKTRNGLLTLEYAEKRGLGSRTYNLVNIDD